MTEYISNIHTVLIQFFFVFSAFRCSKKPDLHRVCRDIAGDANLYTLFRVDGQPIECPFGTQHGFTFSYNRGKGDCQWPESELEPCSDTKRLVLNYQACPNVQGSELRCKLCIFCYLFMRGYLLSCMVDLNRNC